MTKNEQIIKHVESLLIGSKISVRRIAKDLNASEDTVYRVIKDVSQLGVVATIGRAGTVRIEKRSRENLDSLTFNGTADIVEDQIPAGRAGPNKSVSKLAIGAIQLDDILKYIGKHTLLIVGNRKNVQVETLKHETSVLIIGGSRPSAEIIRYADEHELPIISSSYDTFLVANIINKVAFDRKIRKEILVVEDIVKPINELPVLFDSMIVHDYKKIANEIGHTRFPIIDEELKLVGIVTSREIISMNEEGLLGKVMTKNPSSVKLANTVANYAHLLTWEGIELLPITDNNRKVVGVINRQGVLRSM